VKKTGCSGWGYVADLAKDARPGDTVFEDQGVRIYVDAESLDFVDGTEIDFLKAGVNEQFVFRNPNATARMRVRRELHHAGRRGLSVARSSWAGVALTP
jgi:iron-sulfur cluster assembly accessory protein